MKNLSYLLLVLVSFSSLVSMDRLTPDNPYEEFDAQCDRLEMKIKNSDYNNRRKLPKNHKKEINQRLAQLNPMQEYNEWRQRFSALEPHLAQRDGHVLGELKAIKKGTLSSKQSLSSDDTNEIQRYRLQALHEECTSEKNTTYLLASLSLLKKDYEAASTVCRTLQERLGIQHFSSSLSVSSIPNNDDKKTLRTLHATDKKYHEQRAIFLVFFNGYYPNFNVYAQNIRGDTLLHCMMFHKLLPCVKYCVELGADVNARNNEKETPLHVGACSKDTETMQYLLLLSKINARDIHGITPLIKAANWGNKEAVALLLTCADLKLQLCDNDGLNAQDRAQTTAKHNEEIGALLYRKVPMTPKGKCLLRELSGNTISGPTQTLATCHVDRLPSMIDISGIVPHQSSLQACFSSSSQLPKKTAQPVPKKSTFKPAKQSELEELIRKNDCKGLKEFLKQNHGSYTLNARYKEWASPLWYAVAANNGNEFLTKLFLQYGASPNILNTSDAPPLMAALHDGKIEIIKELLAYGADVNICCDVYSRKIKNKMPLIYFAACSSSSAAIEKLCQAGAAINTVHDPLVGTPLHLAASAQNCGSVQALLDAGAKTGIPNKDGDIPLHFVAQDENDQQGTQCSNPIRTALFNCTDMFVKNNDGESPYDIARRRKHYGFIIDWAINALERGASLSLAIKQELIKKGINPQDFVKLLVDGKIIFDQTDPENIKFLALFADLEKLSKANPSQKQ